MNEPRKSLAIEAPYEAGRISRFIADQVIHRFRRRGAVVGLSGGVDSALVAALCVKALGPERVLGLIMPEKESSQASEPLAMEQAAVLGILTERVDLTPVLTALGAYEQKCRVLQGLCPEYDPDTDRTKITLPPRLLEQDRVNYYSLTVEKPDGSRHSSRVGPDDLREIAAAQNLKQRNRMIQLYHRAEKLHYVVAGTTNRSEFVQGFFVKHGDGAVDIEPIAHLYKTQVFELARHVGVIEAIVQRQPSPDTWSGGVTDEEFYFRIPYDQLDLLLSAWGEGVPAEEAARELGLSAAQAARAFREFEARRRATWHLRVAPPSLLEPWPQSVMEAT